MSTSINYSQMPISEKFSMLEALWENMSRDAAQNGFTPQWHLDVLAQREEALKSQKASFCDIQETKSRLQKLL